MQSCKWGRKSKSNIILLSICNGNIVAHCQHNSAWIHLGSGKEGRAYRGDGHSLSPPTWARSSPQICPVIREVLFIDESTAIDRMVSTQVCLLVWWVHCTCSTNCAQTGETVPSFMALQCSFVLEKPVSAAVRKRQQPHSYLLCFPLMSVATMWSSVHAVTG